ncbi:NUDIX domain-containing protein [Thiomicrospira sp. WB1]|jgi:ADP-ribose pyrophosphatase|uniref:NUDIX domain-containing protein n=1 Tax=Thiomicrospira sp. WB1 TaxID=1685380 RepID=UPI00074B318B|nr:NUDIX domain-containing protein [Thiomicrospira sp. WB1]KUJ72143.1 nucleoside diphosphate pyrophosphatase [Thiomicrospira sp. WB1]
MSDNRSDPFQYRLRIESIEPAFEGFFRIDRVRFQHQRFQGGWSETLERELFGRGQAVLVLLYDCASRQVLLIEQCRAGALKHARHQSEKAWLLEPVAGMIDSGESAQQACARETQEEAGVTVQDFEYVCQFYPSPGGSDEVLHLYAAEIDFSELPALAGAKEEHEDIRLVPMKFEQAEDRLRSGRFNVASTIVALQWLFFQRLEESAPRR